MGQMSTSKIQSTTLCSSSAWTQHEDRLGKCRVQRKAQFRRATSCERCFWFAGGWSTHMLRQCHCSSFFFSTFGYCCKTQTCQIGFPFWKRGPQHFRIAQKPQQNIRCRNCLFLEQNALSRVRHHIPLYSIYLIRNSSKWCLCASHTKSSWLQSTEAEGFHSQQNLGTSSQPETWVPRRVS